MFCVSFFLPTNVDITSTHAAGKTHFIDNENQTFSIKMYIVVTINGYRLMLLLLKDYWMRTEFVFFDKVGVIFRTWHFHLKFQVVYLFQASTVLVMNINMQDRKHSRKNIAYTIRSSAQVVRYRTHVPLLINKNTPAIVAIKSTFIRY